MRWKTLHFETKRFDSVWSNHLGKAQTTMAIKQMENCDFVLKSADVLKNTTDNVLKSNKCNQSDYMPLLVQAIWGHIWKDTVEKSQTNATNALCRSCNGKVEIGIFKFLREKYIWNIWTRIKWEAKLKTSIWNILTLLKWEAKLAHWSGTKWTDSMFYITTDWKSITNREKWKSEKIDKYSFTSQIRRLIQNIWNLFFQTLTPLFCY